MSTTFTIEGVAVGTLWLPPVEGFKEISYSFQKTKDSITTRNKARTLREALETIDRWDGGDFQDTKYDGVLCVTRNNYPRITKRYFNLRIFKSIQDYLTTEPFEYPEDYYA